MKFKATDVQLSCSGGDGFHAHFAETRTGHSSYVLIQNYFEFEHGPAYFECNNLDLAGHGRLKRCEVRRNSLEIDLDDSTEHITVVFDEPEEKVGQLVWILGIILAKRALLVNSAGVPEIPIEYPDEDLMF